MQGVRERSGAAARIFGAPPEADEGSGEEGEELGSRITSMPGSAVR